jgi:P4 family phage/plasmid primase-like protien
MPSEVIHAQDDESAFESDLTNDEIFDEPEEITAEQMEVERQLLSELKEKTAPTVIDAIIVLAAHRDDGTGFSKFDREEHEGLITKALLDCISLEEENAAYKTLKIYEEQLKNLGIEYAKIGYIPREAEQKEAREQMASANKLVSEDVAIAELNGNGITTFRFMHSRAAQSIIDKMPVVLGEEDGQLYYWHGDIWRPNADEVIHTTIDGLVGETYNTRLHKEVMTLVKKTLSFTPVKFDTGPYLLGLKNGVADLRTGEVRPYEKDDYITYRIPVFHYPTAKCPMFLKFLGDIAPDDKDKMTLVDWFTIHAFRKMFPYVLFMLGLGRNGKGLYQKLLERFYGSEAFRSLRIEETKNNFAGGYFQGKLGLIVSEAGEDKGKGKKTIPTSFIKMVTGDGLIDSDVKNKDRVRFKPYFKTTFDCNDMPLIVDRSRGWIERFIKVDLPFVYIANPDPDNPLERQKDPHLFEKLSTDEELSGILNLVLFRAAEIAKTDEIIKRSGEEMFNEYSAQSSSAETFLDQFCEYDVDKINVKIPSNRIYNAYTEWCQYTVSELIDDSMFGKLLSKMCQGCIKSNPRAEDGTRSTVYHGLFFDEERFKIALSELKKSRGITMVDVVDGGRGKVGEEKGQQVTMVDVVEVKEWKSIMERFGNLHDENNSL